MKKTLRITLVIIFSIIFLYCGVRLLLILRDYAKADAIYEASQKAYFTLTTPASSPSSTPAPSETDVSAPDESNAPISQETFPEVEIDFDALLSINPEIVGWIWIPDTTINYPLLQSEDNYKYLSYAYDLQRTNAGSIFLDYRSSTDFSDWNTLIFGHNMKSGSMFAPLKNYSDQTFWETHPEIYIFTPDVNYKYRIFSAYTTTTGSKSYAIEFSVKSFVDYIDLICGESLIHTDTEPTDTDRLLMLSTCTSVLQTERFVVHAVRVGIQERQGLYE